MDRAPIFQYLEEINIGCRCSLSKQSPCCLQPLGTGCHSIAAGTGALVGIGIRKSSFAEPGVGEARSQDLPAGKHHRKASQ